MTGVHSCDMRYDVRTPMQRTVDAWARHGRGERSDQPPTAPPAPVAEREIEGADAERLESLITDRRHDDD